MTSVDSLNLTKLTGAMSVLMQPAMNDAYLSPRKPPRVGQSGEAASYLERDRGTLWIGRRSDEERERDDVIQRGCCSARVPRVVGGEAEDIWRKSYGTLKELMAVEERRHPSPCLRSVSEEDVGPRSSNLMRSILNSEANKGYRTSRPPRSLPTEDAERNAARNKGCMNAVFDTEANKTYSTALPRPRTCSSEAEANALRNKGTMSSLFSHLNNPVPSTAPPDKCKTEKRGGVWDSTTNYGKSSTSSCPRPRNRGEGSDIAQYGKNGSLHHLLRSYGRLPRSPRPQSRMRPEARRYANRNKGATMAKYLSPNKPAVRRPTKTVNRKYV